MKLLKFPENWYEAPVLPSGPGANSTPDACPGGLELWLMSVVSYCPFRGKKATGLNGTEKACAIVSVMDIHVSCEWEKACDRLMTEFISWE